MAVETKHLTPLGGDRSVAYFFGADGSEVESAEGAVRAEIVEYLGDEVLGRTYGELGLPEMEQGDSQWAEPYGPNRPENSDAIKTRTWDIYDGASGSYALVTTLSQLWSALGHDHLPPAEKRGSLVAMMDLPSWIPAPPQLKEEARAWLEDAPAPSSMEASEHDPLAVRPPR